MQLVWDIQRLHSAYYCNNLCWISARYYSNNLSVEDLLHALMLIVCPLTLFHSLAHILPLGFVCPQPLLHILPGVFALLK